MMINNILSTRLGLVSTHIHEDKLYKIQFINKLQSKELRIGATCAISNAVYSIIEKNADIADQIPIFMSGTKFQQSVWNAISAIKRGQIATYADIAHAIGNQFAVRAVANACGKNPIPIVIPCHRVIRSDGKMGGYSGGIEIKRKLLSVEGFNFTN